MDRIYTNFQQNTPKLQQFKAIEGETYLSRVNSVVKIRNNDVFMKLKRLQHATESSHFSSTVRFFVAKYCHLP